jgi:hypothetical protein
MLRSMQLENFKAFGQRTVIPLAPITLIFGQNSSGKSSILQSLNLLKQTRESRDVDALLLPRTENGFADLGSFQDMLFDHDLRRTLSIRVDMQIDSSQKQQIYPLSRRVPHSLRKSSAIGLEMVFSRKSIKDEIDLDGIRLCGEDSSSFIAEFTKMERPRNYLSYIQSPYRSERRRRGVMLRWAKCTIVRPEPDFWKHQFEHVSKERESLNEVLRNAKNNLVDRPSDFSLNRRKSLDNDGESIDESLAKLLIRLEETIGFLSKDFSYGAFVEWVVRQQEGTVVAMDGFVPNIAGPAKGNWELDVILNRSMHRQHIFGRPWTSGIGHASVYAGQLLEQNLGSLFPLGPFRKPPSRWYIFTGTTPRDVGYQGQLLPDLLFRNNDLLNNTNDWLKKLDIGYEIKLHPLGGDRPSDLFELRLMDIRRKTPVEVGLSDVGFGISQILPLVVQSLAGEDQIITVEQPEVHIHPKLQADLGDLLIEAIKEPRRNQFIIETHSEHLALRLQRRVREKKLAPDQISIVYVSRGPNGAEVHPLGLDDDGDFTDTFPGGFFPERLRELR